jgi:hypothetical protein
VRNWGWDGAGLGLGLGLGWGGAGKGSGYPNLRDLNCCMQTSQLIVLNK